MMRRFHSVFILMIATQVLTVQANEGTAAGGKIGSYEDLERSLLRGWNTWNNSSVLSHVLMPEGLSLDILFRKKRGGPYYLREATISNKQLQFPENIRPGYHAYDGSYTDLTLEWQGVEARIQTASDGRDIVILYTPIRAPSNPPVLILQAGILWNRQGSLKRMGDEIAAECSESLIRIRSLKKTTHVMLPLKTPYFTCESGEENAFYTGEGRTIEEIRQLVNAKRSEHEKRMRRFGEFSEIYNAMQTLLAWNLIYDAENDRAITPVSRVWNDAWGGYILFDWDTYFTALMLALDHPELAWSNAIAITDAVTEDGFIPNLEASFGVKTFDRSQPPVGSLACRMIYDKYGGKWFLERVYGNLLSWNRWWPGARGNRGYLSWGTKPHARSIDPPNKQAAKFESGLDNSPLFDEAEFDSLSYRLTLASVGLMALYIADCRALADIALELGKNRDALELVERGRVYGERLQELWDEKSGMHRDLDLKTNTFSPHLAPTHFYPLLSGIPSPKQAARMMETLKDTAFFAGPYMLPSIARNDPAYRDNSYWRGRIWPPMNFLVYLGLRKYGLEDEMKMLAESSVRLVLKEWMENHHVYENYNAESGVGGDVRNANCFYTWGGLLSLIGLMEKGFWED